MADLTFRAAEPSDAGALSRLAHEALVPHTLPGWTAQAIERLLDENSEGRLREYLENTAFSEVGLVDTSLVAFITSKLPRLISLLIVSPLSQRQGIGSKLLRRKLAHVSLTAPEVSVVEVNATEYSLPFYRKHAFYPISEFINYEGCRFARLGYWRKNPMLGGAN